MGVPFELNTMIVTKGKEIREEENIFTLKKKGYRLYPIDIPLDVRQNKESESNGTAIIHKVEWENGNTLVTYRLISLKSTN